MKMFTIVQGAAFLSVLGQLSTVIAETAAPTTPVPTTGLPTTPTPTTTGTIGAWDFFYTTRKGFADTTETRLFAHGGGIIKEGDTFYMHGQVFNANVTDNTFAGFSMYSSKNQQTWTWQNEGLILPPQPTGELTSARKGERPHIVKCPKTGEFVLFAHAASADYQDNEIVYATSKKVNGTYAYKGPLKNSKGAVAHQKDINTLVDGKVVYVVAEGGDVYKLSSDCHSWTTHTTHPAVSGDEGVLQAPIAIKVGSMYYWIGSRKSDQGFSHFYSTAPAMTGPWTFRGSLHASSASQGSWIESIIGSESSTYVFWRDAWGPYTSDPDPTTSIHSLQNDQAAYELQTLAFSGTQITVTRYLDFGSLMIDYGKGTSWWVSDLTTPPPPFPKPTQAPVPRWGQCGGQGWTGSTTCDESSCVPKNISYSQCM